MECNLTDYVCLFFFCSFRCSYMDLIVGAKEARNLPCSSTLKSTAQCCCNYWGIILGVKSVSLEMDLDLASGGLDP